MNLQEFLNIARRRWWIVVLVALVAAASAFAFSRLQTPVYKSSMKLTIQPARTDFGLTQSAKTLLSSYISIIFTERNAAEVGKRLSLDFLPNYIFGQTRMADDAATFGIQIEVRDYDGDTANRIAREWAQIVRGIPQQRQCQAAPRRPRRMRFWATIRAIRRTRRAQA